MLLCSLAVRTPTSAIVRVTTHRHMRIRGSHASRGRPPAAKWDGYTIAHLAPLPALPTRITPTQVGGSHLLGYPIPGAAYPLL